MTITDQIGNLLTFDHIPQRIVSLVPSQTELLVDLGLQDQIVGVTKFCVHPENLRKEKTIVGGTKQVHYDKIKALEPDIILCNKEENTKEMVIELQKIAPVHVSDVKTLTDVTGLIKDYGYCFDISEQAAKIGNLIVQAREDFLSSLQTSISASSVAYVIWKDPLMVSSDDTFINCLLEEIGFKNAFKEKEGRYPEIQLADLRELDYIFLSSEPFPFKQKHIEFFKEHSNAEVILVDGEYFSWYGSRLIKSYPYFTELLKELNAS